MNTATSEQLQRQQLIALLNQQNQHAPEDIRSQPGAQSTAHFPLDPSNAAKQMVALNATAQNRKVNQSGGGTSDSLFGLRQPVPDPVVQANRTTAAAQVLKSRRDEFLKFVANVMNARHTPLPPTITGISSAYDPNTSRWKTIEPTAEPGGFRLAGKDVDLFKLWQVVLSLGGNVKLTRESGWNAVLPHFGLPEELPDAQNNGTTSVARVLAHYYIALLAPFEEVYMRNMQQQQQKVLQARHQQLQQGHTMPSTSETQFAKPPSQPSQSPVQALPPSAPIPLPNQAPSASVDPEPHPMSPYGLDMATPGQQRPPTAPISHTSTPAPQGSELLRSVISNEPQEQSEPVESPSLSHSGLAEDDSENRKRKFPEDDIGKRTRQRTDTSASMREAENVQEPPLPASQVQNTSQLASQITSPTQPSGSKEPSPSLQIRTRRKIEYVPLAREVNTYGGRDLNMIDLELGKLTTRRPQRSIDEWGTIDIDGLTMSLWSRIPFEISYALTVLTILSTMRGQTPDSGFSLHQCDDLLDGLLDLLREQAFGDENDTFVDSTTFWTYRELVMSVREQGVQTFSNSSRPGQGASGLRARPANIIFTILNILRNFSLIVENQRYIAQHPDALALLLRICCLSTPSEDIGHLPPSPASLALSLPELVKVRRDVLTIISCLVPVTNLTSHAPYVRSRLFELLASFLVEPHELSSPSGIFIQSGFNTSSIRPSPLVDLALEAFSKLSQPDTNRLALSRGIKLSWLWTLFNSLVHRLPVSSEDFTITMRMHDLWLSYVEKIVLSIYSICYLASPELKAKIRSDRSLAFPKLILQMVKRFVSINHPEVRQYFLVSSRRAVEALKLIDDGGDAFESPQTTTPQLAFGMGFGDTDAKQTETGIGLLAGFLEDVTWNIMLTPRLDDVMFAELDSLSRIGV